MSQIASTRRVERFKQAVLQMESDRDVKPLVRMFTDTATFDTPAYEQPLVGRLGAMEFWSDYLETFQTVQSQFTHELMAGETAVLEWRSTGMLPTGRSIEYRGVSLVRFKGEEIDAFTAYYDSAAFVPDFAAVPGDMGLNNEGGD